MVGRREGLNGLSGASKAKKRPGRLKTSCLLFSAWRDEEGRRGAAGTERWKREGNPSLMDLLLL